MFKIIRGEKSHQNDTNIAKSFVKSSLTNTDEYKNVVSIAVSQINTNR